MRLALIPRDTKACMACVHMPLYAWGGLWYNGLLLIQSHGVDAQLYVVGNREDQGSGRERALRCYRWLLQLCILAVVTSARLEYKHCPVMCVDATTMLKECQCQDSRVFQCLCLYGLCVGCFNNDTAHISGFKVVHVMASFVRYFSR